MYQELDIVVAIDSGGGHETIRNRGGFGSPPSARRKATGRGLVDPGCRGGCWRKPAIGEPLEKACGKSGREGPGARRQAAARAAVSTLSPTTGEIGPAAAGRAAEGGIRLGSVDHQAGRGTGRAKVRRVVPLDAHWSVDARARLLVPEAPAAEQGAESRGCSSVARAEVATDKKRGNNSKLA